jgi:hypothetical protein
VTKPEMSIENEIELVYQQMVRATHPSLIAMWPLLNGFNQKVGGYKGWLIFFLKNSGTGGFRSSTGIGEMSEGLIGFPEITESNRNAVRQRLEKFFQAKDCDAVVLVGPNGAIAQTEFEYMLRKHEHYMGLAPMKLFLSHKGADKATIREYKKLLEELGLSPWLDEDAMSAGTELERGILKGFEDSCAAIFFVTPNYKDENYLATEIDYAIAEKRKKGNKFSIVTLVLDVNGQKGSVPSLLTRYVWKEPVGELEAVREILRAIPIQVGPAYWKDGI